MAVALGDSAARRHAIAERWPDSAGRFEAWVRDAYERHGLRGSVMRAMAAATLFTLPWAVIAVTMAVVAVGGSLRVLLISIALNVGLASLGLAVAVAIEMIELGRIDRWNAGGRPAAEADQMLRLVVTSPVRWTNFGLTAYLALWIPVFTWWFIEISGSATMGVLLVAGGVFVATPVVWPVAVFTQELAHRPMLVSLWSEFPDLEPPRERRHSVANRAWLPVPLLTLSTGYSVGLFVIGLDGPVAETAVAIALGFAFTIVYVAILRLAVTEAALRPLDDLAVGVARAAADDFTSRVPITSSDEFAYLARAFNGMTDQLAQHSIEMAESRRRLLAAADEARRRVDRDLHGGAWQNLVLVDLKLKHLARAVADRPKAAALTADLALDLKHALDELNDLTHGLYPPILRSDGVAAALRAAVMKSSSPVEVLAQGVTRAAEGVEAAVYFCCLEAMQNAAKHAGPTAQVAVTLTSVGDELRFTVADDGTGYDASTIRPSAGLQNMADRINALGGSLRVDSSPGAGTTVSGTVPWRRP